jgi:DHA3 family macrolide efflux protein-like MFS transporter
MPSGTPVHPYSPVISDLYSTYPQGGEFGRLVGTSMKALARTQATWKRLFELEGFPAYFTGMFISLFGTGLNFAGVTLYVLAKTGSTVQVSFTVILLTVPRLIIPFFGGVMADRVDRRYLGIALDLLRAAVVLGVATLAAEGRLQLWQLYLMVLLLGIAFAVYWTTSLAMLQELIPPRYMVGANAAVLVAVQGGMLVAGTIVGFLYDHSGLAPILAIDGATYLISAICFYLLRSGYAAPRRQRERLRPATALEIESALEEQAILALDTSQSAPGVFSDIAEGLRFLGRHPSVLALGLTNSVMMAGVISANVIVVALANDLLHSGARGYGFLQAGWALGAVAGGLVALSLPRRYPRGLLTTALAILAVGHALFPFAGLIAVAVAMNALFGGCRAIGSVLTQSSILKAVPQYLMGRTQSAFAVIATVLQIVTSFVLGWLAEHTSLQAAFLTLGLLYGAAVLIAIRAEDFGNARKAHAEVQ